MIFIANHLPYKQMVDFQSEYFEHIWVDVYVSIHSIWKQVRHVKNKDFFYLLNLLTLLIVHLMSLIIQRISIL